MLPAEGNVNEKDRFRNPQKICWKEQLTSLVPYYSSTSVSRRSLENSLLKIMKMLLSDVANAALPFVNFHHQPLPDILPGSPRLQRHLFYVLLMQYYLLRRLNSLLRLLSDCWDVLSTLTFTSVFSYSLNCFWLTLTLFFFFSFFPFNF